MQVAFREGCPAPGRRPDRRRFDRGLAGRYLDAAVRGVRSGEVAGKIALHLARFADHFTAAHGHERLSAVVRREVVTWRTYLADDSDAGDPQGGGLGLAPATVNAHLASLSGFTSWVIARDPAALPHGNPCAKVSDLPLPPLEPRALSQGQVRSLKNVLDRLERFHQHKGRRRGGGQTGVHGHGRPLRDRAIVYVLLSTGLRREELVRLDLDQVTPGTPNGLRAARRAKISGVRGKGRPQPARLPVRRLHRLPPPRRAPITAIDQHHLRADRPMARRRTTRRRPAHLPAVPP